MKRTNETPAPDTGFWRPSVKWHAAALVLITAGVVVFYLVVDGVLSRQPPPYGLRDVPKEMTPWLR